MPAMILHLVVLSDWTEASQHSDYRPASLASEGFIHCSTPNQVAEVANERFSAQHGMGLLVIDENLVEPEVRWEDSSGQGQDFPHIYGALNRAAVVDVMPFEPDADGVFQAPVL